MCPIKFHRLSRSPSPMQRYRGRPVSWHPRLEPLEDRRQPGSVLSADVGLDPVQDLRPPTASEQKDILIRRVLKRPADDDNTSTLDIALAGPVGQTQVTAPTPRSELAPNRTATAAPVMPLPGQPSTHRLGSLPNIRPPQLRPQVQPVMRRANIEPAPYDLRFERHDCEGVGAKVPIYNTYDGGPGFDANLAVAAGRGPGAVGSAYAVGFEGPVGSIDSYLPGGACGVSFDVIDPAGVVINDVAMNTNGVYVVGTIGGGAVGTFVMQLTPDLDPLAFLFFPPPPGGTISFEGVGLGQGGTMPNVLVTGSVMGFLPYETMIVDSFDEDLIGSTYGDMIIVDYLTPSAGEAIEGDRPANSYVGGYLITPAGMQMPVAQQVMFFGDPGWTFVYPTPGPTADPDNGFHGIDVLAGDSAAGGVYLAGSNADFLLNPAGSDNFVLVKLEIPTGAPLYMGPPIALPPFDYAARDVVADRDGNAYTIGYFGPAGGHQAALEKWDPTGAGPIDGVLVGDLAFAPPLDDLGYGIDLVMPTTTSDVFIAGSTETPPPLMFPFPIGCDPILDPMTDGFVASFTQPF